MIPGYNHNIKYGDKIYHVQTEDSGVENPHIITHLFLGGNIVESRKTSYADFVKSSRLKEMLVELMQDQHKAMLRDLIGGKLEQKIIERSVNAATLDGPAPLNVEAGAQHRSSFLGPSVDLGKVGGEAPKAPSKPMMPISVPTPPPASPDSIWSTAPAVTRGAPPPAAAARMTSNAVTHYAPPPPAPGGEKFIEAETLQKAFDSKNESAVDSIFGEDLISEKSLDEVILSYLAEDMNRK